ncbi:rRNA biogenesis protein RRP5 isoform X2 [Populus alba]|uniref:rRNA biogenesis protein RRP5 isoform X2 n=1 Tax=Populus alba TaxID=43335 RepID=UPI003CC77DC6
MFLNQNFVFEQSDNWHLSLLLVGYHGMHLSKVLTAYVKSIEDHGFILHFGLSSFMGFLPKNSQAESRDSEVKTGQFLQGIVTRIDKTRKVVYLSSDPDTVSKCVTKDLKGISIDLLIPGMMVDARVQSTLENGIMLSFLTYFTGTVDMFHLQNTFPTSNWKDDYAKNKKVNARILFIDPSTRAVGLTLNQHLVHNNSPPSSVKVGDIYDIAKVVRVDKGMGLLLEIPSTPLPTPAFVNVSDVAEDEVRKLEKKFKEGSNVRVRILGYRHLEGLATGILKASAFEGSVFTHSDVKPGMATRAKIIAVDSFGAIVQFPGGVKALCPLRHMSEFEIAKPRKKFKVGAELFFRVLGCKSKRITVTHKKTLVKSKLPILSSYSDATDGLITHGWITKIEKPGCFVHFYNGVQGFAPRSELGLEPGSDAISTYQVGQVVKCRVISSIAASRRINLSFIMKPLRFSEEDGIKMGSVVTGVIDKVTASSVIVYVNAKDYLKGTIATEHLSDHHEHAALMKSVLKPGYEFDQLLVLDIESNNLALSAKYSLIKSASQLPSDLSQIRPQSIVHGYICNMIETGCFVRFLGNLTAFSPRSKAMDDQRSQLSEAFYVGQSVRSNILDVNNETSRITVSLKQSCCSSTDACFLQEYFLLENKIADLQSSDSKGRDLKWVEGFHIGSTIEGKIQESKEFGVVVSFEKHNDVFGFVSHHQLGGAIVKAGANVRAAVLDVAKTERLVDLSLKLEFLDKSRDKSSNSLTHKKKRKGEMSKDLEVHQTVNAVVEIVKENYLVLSIPEHNYAIGYASVSDYNTQKISQKQFLNGQSVSATVMALPTPSTAGRLLLLLKSISEVTETSSSKKAKRKSSCNVGSLVQAEITEIKPLEMRLKFGIGFRGRIHITEVNDNCLLENPFSNFRVGQTVSARIIAKAGQSDNKKSQLWDLSIKPKMLEDSCTIEDKLVPKEYEFSSGQRVSGYVYKVDGEWAWLTISRHLKAKLFVLDSACEPIELQEFQKRFYVGKAVTGHVLNYNKEKASLRLALHPFAASQTLVDGGAPVMDDLQSNAPWDNVTAHIQEGDIVGGRISKILPGVGGLLVQLGPHIHGRVHFTELQDSWVPDPLSAYKEGQFVKSKVLEISHPVKGTIHIDLSLRLSLNGLLGQNSAEFSNNQDAPSKRVDKIEDLQPDMVVQGYVKNVSSKGCFISLSRKLDAKILLSNLSEGYIDDPEKEFPIGKLLTGRVLSVEHLSKRIEVTLKSSVSNVSKSEKSDLSRLHVGEIISGRIKRVESYGLFIALDHTNLVGLCHVSQLLDHIGNIESKYKAGEKVTAKILKVDEERRRISLGMKNLDVRDDMNSSKEESDEEMSENESMDDSNAQIKIIPESSLLGIHNIDVECQNEGSILAQAESRASIPPLEVTLDDMEHSHPDDVLFQNQGHIDEADTMVKKNKQEKKKPKKLSEQEISAAEERRLEEDEPRTADEFEMVIRSSPNNSFLWIAYMRFMLSLADIEKARSIAERALNTINIREEDEKLNIWVAYFNLENEYGNPPEDAVKKVFQRALQYCDPKKVHLALLKMYKKTNQNKLAEELLDKMSKKFKHSCKFWLKRVKWLLKQKQDGVQSVVQRALLCLPRHKHIKFISQTAIREFKCGVADRGRTLFEEILREYPKRTDLWSVYLDQEIKLGDADVIRALFERAISLSLPPKKMKFLFKKYLEYEKSYGDEKQIESVKQKAMEYVQNTLA